MTHFSRTHSHTLVRRHAWPLVSCPARSHSLPVGFTRTLLLHFDVLGKLTPETDREWKSGHPHTQVSIIHLIVRNVQYCKNPSCTYETVIFGFISHEYKITSFFHLVSLSLFFNLWCTRLSWLKRQICLQQECNHPNLIARKAYTFPGDCPNMASDLLVYFSGLAVGLHTSRRTCHLCATRHLTLLHENASACVGVDFREAKGAML